MFRFLVGTAALVIVLAALRSAHAIVTPLLVATLVAYVCMPAVVWLEKKRLPGPLALTIVLMAVGSVFVVLATVIGSSIVDITGKVPYYKERLDDLKTGALEQAAAWGIDVTDATPSGHFDPSELMDFLPTLLAGVNSLFSGLFLVVLLVIFILANTGRPETILRLKGKPGAAASLERIKDDVRRYMVLKIVAGFIQGAAITVWLLVLGIDYALLWGLLGGLLNFIPQIGGIVAAAIPGVLALIEHGLGTALLVGCGIGVVTTVVENFIQPRLFGKGLGLSMLTVVVAVILWGWLLGPIGMFMAVPLTTMLKRILEEHEETAFAAALLGDPPRESS